MFFLHAVTVRTDSYLFSKFTIKFDILKNLTDHRGGLLPACQFKIDKEGQLRIELLRNAWRLANVRIR